MIDHASATVAVPTAHCHCTAAAAAAPIALPPSLCPPPPPFTHPVDKGVVSPAVAPPDKLVLRLRILLAGDHHLQGLVVKHNPGGWFGGEGDKWRKGRQTSAASLQLKPSSYQQFLPAATSRSETHLTRVAWIVRKTPSSPASAATGVAPSTAENPAMARRPMGTLNDGSGMTVGRTARLTGALASFFPKLKNCVQRGGWGGAGRGALEGMMMGGVKAERGGGSRRRHHSQGLTAAGRTTILLGLTARTLCALGTGPVLWGLGKGVGVLRGSRIPLARTPDSAGSARSAKRKSSSATPSRRQAATPRTAAVRDCNGTGVHCDPRVARDDCILLNRGGWRCCGSDRSDRV
jgi:hypothetical protein